MFSNGEWPLTPFCDGNPCLLCCISAAQN
jgi:hypothetical protein